MNGQVIETQRTGPRATRAARLVEDVVGGAFDVKKFVENFDVLAEAGAGLERLREFVLDVAIRGLLSDEGQSDGSAGAMLARIRQEQLRAMKAREIDRVPTVDPIQPDELPYSLPSGWAWTRLVGCVLTIQIGPFGSLLHQRDYVNGGTPLVNPAHIKDGRIVPEAKKGVARDTLGRLAGYRMRSGDVVMGRRGEMGRCAVITPMEDGWLCGTGSLFVRPTQDLAPEFLATWLRSPLVRKRLEGESVGSTMNNLNLRILNNLVFALPPLAEQKRIVARVDQLMALIDDLDAKQTRKREVGARFTKASLEGLTTAAGPEEFDTAWTRVVENFPTVIDNAEKVRLVRGALIDLAVSGLLTGARPGAWASQSLAQVATETRYGTSKKCDRDTSLTPVLRIPNVVGGALDLSDLKYAAFTDAELEDLSLAEGDLLVVRSNGSKDLVGRASVVDARASGFAYAGYLVRLRVNREMVEPAWIQLALRGTRLRTQIESPIRTTTGVHNINTTEILGLSLPIPSLEEQRGALARIRSLMRLCDDLEAKLRRAEDRASKLVEAVVQEMVA